MSSEHAEEILSGERFAFGENWSKFLATLNEERIRLGECSLQNMLEVQNLEGKRFIDIGSGSGLFSLAARRLGATVHSFDYDPQSVACTRELRNRYFPNDPKWHVEPGSALDSPYQKTLGRWDIVYSWGVLHHTGAMWQALENVVPLVDTGGKLFIAIYNDQGGWSRRWRIVKSTYNKLPKIIRPLFAFAVMVPREIKFLTLCGLQGKPWMYFDNIRHYAEKSARGMSYWHDLIDWIGGYPFEVAKPEEIFNFYRDRGFVLRQIKNCAGGLACNEFVFEKLR